MILWIKVSRLDKIWFRLYLIGVKTLFFFNLQLLLICFQSEVIIYVFNNIMKKVNFTLLLFSTSAKETLIKELTP